MTLLGKQYLENNNNPPKPFLLVFLPLLTWAQHFLVVGVPEKTSLSVFSFFKHNNHFYNLGCVEVKSLVAAEYFVKQIGFQGVFRL